MSNIVLIERKKGATREQYGGEWVECMGVASGRG